MVTFESGQDGDRKSALWVFGGAYSKEQAIQRVLGGVAFMCNLLWLDERRDSRHGKIVGTRVRGRPQGLVKGHGGHWH